MYRQYSSRNQRNKGIKVKHALQICVLLAVCFWLIYQIKHSHDKNKGFEETDGHYPLDEQSIGGLIKIGRKDIRPLYQETVKANDRHDQVAEEEITEVENNHEKDRSPDKKVEEENKPSIGGYDKTDEHEMEKSDTEVDQEDRVGNEHEEDSITDVAGEDRIDNETEEASDDGNGGRQENSVEDASHDGGDKSNHEAHEELYKADDASSAATHDNYRQTAKNENKFVRISSHLHDNILDLENNENHGEEVNTGQMKEQLEVDNGEKSEDVNQSSATDIATNVSITENKENNLESSEKDSAHNSILTEAYDDNLAAINSVPNFTAQNPMISEQNVTQSVPDQGIVTEGTSTEGSNFKTIALEQANNSTLDMENHPLYFDSTDRAESTNSESNFEDFSKPSSDIDSFTDTDSFAVVRITRTGHHSMEDGANTHKKETMSAKSVSSDGTDEVSEYAVTENENPSVGHTDSTALSGSANS